MPPVVDEFRERLDRSLRPEKTQLFAQDSYLAGIPRALQLRDELVLAQAQRNVLLVAVGRPVTGFSIPNVDARGHREARGGVLQSNRDGMELVLLREVHILQFGRLRSVGRDVDDLPAFVGLTKGEGHAEGVDSSRLEDSHRSNPDVVLQMGLKVGILKHDLGHRDLAQAACHRFGVLIPVHSIAGDQAG